MKASVQLFYDNHDEDTQSLSYNLYYSINETLLPQLPQLLSIYKTDALIEKQLIELVSFITFPSISSLESITSILIDLFKREQDRKQANHILYLLTHIHVQSKEEEGNEGVSTQDILHKTIVETVELWKSFFKSFSSELFGISKVNDSCHTLCVLLSRMVNLCCYSNECSYLEEKEVFTDIELILMDVKSTLLGNHSFTHLLILCRSCFY